jgi:hypothetical protein
MKLDALLPMAAPAPAGLIIGVQLYKSTIDTIGGISPEWSTPVHVFAGLFAAAGCVGMIGAEITAYKQAGIALAENQKGAALISVLAGIVCSALVIWAVWTGDSARAVVGSVIISIMGYIALASRDFLARRRGVAQGAEVSADKDKAFALAMTKEQTKQAAAAARLAKAERSQAAPAQATDESFRKVSESFGSWPNVPHVDRIRISVMSKAEIMAAYNVSERTALNWMKYAKGIVK